MSTNTSRPILGSTDSAIQPSDVNICSSGRVGRFGKHEVEVVAGRLVHFFQNIGRWRTFEIEELATYYIRNGWKPEESNYLHGLRGTWSDMTGEYDPGETYIIQTAPGTFAVTEEFIQTCMAN